MANDERTTRNDERAVVIGVGAAADIPAGTLYRILALRSAVFVVEQDCVYLDPDGRELDDGTLLLWAARGAEVLATLRVLDEPDGSVRIGRVATATAARGAGLAGRLLERALAVAGGRVVVLHAQSHLADWYGRFGFVREGADFVEDDIPHTPMRRPAS